jgi:hypothetical protein
LFFSPPCSLYPWVLFTPGEDVISTEAAHVSVSSAAEKSAFYPDPPSTNEALLL